MAKYSVADLAAITVVERFFHRRIRDLRTRAADYDQPPPGRRRAPAAAKSCADQADDLTQLRDALLKELRHA